jgi:hypothetical protein
MPKIHTKEFIMESSWPKGRSLKIIFMAEMLQKTRRHFARAGQEFKDKSKYSRKKKHKNASFY